MFDLILGILFEIVKAFLSRQDKPASAHPQVRKSVGGPQAAPPPSGKDKSASDKKTDEVWEAYRRKQEAMEAELRSKAPKW